MTRFPALLLACLCLLLTHGIAGDDVVKGDRNTDRIAELIKQLSAPEPEQRDAAVAELKKLDAAVVKPLLQTAFGEDAEAGILAVNVLEDLQVVEDLKVVSAAEDALQKITEEGRAHVARRAEAAWDRHFETRQRRVTEYIRQNHGNIWLWREFPSLRRDDVNLDLPHTIVIGKEWTGGDTALQHIARLDSVQIVYLTKGHPVSQESLAEFRRVRPQVQISLRGAGFLGVSHGPHSFGCQISSVKPGTPAAQAGLEPFDVIVEFGGVPTQTPDDLIDAISNFSPGDQIKVVVLRDPIMRRDFNGFGRWSIYQATLYELLNQEEPESVFLPIAVFHSMKTEVTVKLGVWKSPQ